MGLSSLWSRPKPGLESNSGSVLLDDAFLDTYDIVRVNDEPGKEFAVVVPKVRHLSHEMGSSAPSPFSSWMRQEYNQKLQGSKGLEKYNQMRLSDGVVRGTLRSVKIPVLSARWYTQPAITKEMGRNKKKLAQEQADFVWWNLTEGMSISFTQVLAEAMLMCEFGYFMFEKVWENRLVDGKMRTVLAKLAPRHPMDVKEWHKDANGGPIGVTMYTDTLPYEQFIPIDKLLVFSFDREAGNIEGISVLRSAYKHWYFKEQLYKIDAIQKERHGIGIPVIILPLGFKPDDKTIAEDLGRNIRTNDKAHIVLPPGWEISMLKLEGQLVDALKSIEVHDDAIRENVLLNFLGKNATTTTDQDIDLFLKGSRNVSDIVSDTICLYLVPQLVNYNWPGTFRLPKVKARRIGDENRIRTLTFALRNLISTGAIRPDDVLEEWIRDEMDLPAPDYATYRDVLGIDIEEDSEEEDPTNQKDPNDPDAEEDIRQQGTRQATVRNQRKGRRPGNRNAGTDRSGGK